jgi:PAS domain S-box-containing protein
MRDFQMKNVLLKNADPYPTDYTDELHKTIHELEKELEGKDKIINELKTNQIWYETIVENSGAGFIIYDDNTKILMVNPQHLKQYGYQKEDMIGHSWTEFVHEDDVGYMLGYHRARSIDPSSAPRNYIYRGYSKDRSIRYVYLTTVLIPNTKLRVASGIDVTDMVNFEKALGESEKKYRLLVETMNDGLIM